MSHTIVPEVQNGNWLLERGTVTFKDGHTAAMADAYFEIRGQTTEYGGQKTDSRSGSTRQSLDTAGAARPTNGNSATITVSSVPGQPQSAGTMFTYESSGLYAPLFTAIDPQPGVGGSSPNVVIDWSAKSTGDDAGNPRKKQKGKQPANRLTDFLGVAPPSSLTDATGLSVTTPKTEEPKQPFVERRQRVSVAPDGTKLTNER